MAEFKVFEGCTIGNRIPFVEAACRKVFDKLGIQTSEAPFSCCPDPTGFASFDHDGWLAIGARNLSLAEAEGKDILSLCNGCTNTLRLVNHALRHDNLKKDKINQELAKIGKEYKGNIDVKHFVTVLKDQTDKIKNSMVKSLAGIKVACHPGCHYMRPSEIMEVDDPMHPKDLRELVAACGATVIDYDEEVLCCGSSVSNAIWDKEKDNNWGLEVLKKKIDSVKESGADCIVVNCPACFQQFDGMQRDLSKKFGEEYKIPVLYITELMALGMGISADEIGMKFHRTRASSLLEKIG
jgi:heterodisulfide reductase subunit B